MHGANVRRPRPSGPKSRRKDNTAMLMAPIAACKTHPPRFGLRPSACLLLALLLAACTPSAGDSALGEGNGALRFPRLTAVPDRPEGLPTEEILAERRRRLESDRDAALGKTGAGLPDPPIPEPLPELTDTMEELPVERPAAGLVEDPRAGVSVQVATVFFPGDSTDLDRQMIDVLSQVAREQQAIGGSLRVVGHGGVTVSQDLARRQMAEISQTLVRMGVPPTLIGTELGPPGGAGTGDHGRAVIYLDY